jgi:hypothetical protein
MGLRGNWEIAEAYLSRRGPVVAFQEFKLGLHARCFFLARDPHMGRAERAAQPRGNLGCLQGHHRACGRIDSDKKRTHSLDHVRGGLVIEFTGDRHALPRAQRRAGFGDILPGTLDW